MPCGSCLMPAGVEIEPLDVRPPAGRDQQIAALDGLLGRRPRARPRSAGACRRTRSTLTPLRIVTPSRASASSTMAAHSGSSLPSGCAASSTVTSAPSRRNACASSSPTGPPPMTIRCFGRSRELEDVLVGEIGHLLEPGIGGTAGARAGGDHEAARLDLELTSCSGPTTTVLRVAKARRALDHADAEAGEALLGIVRRDRGDDAMDMVVDLGELDRRLARP